MKLLNSYSKILGAKIEKPYLYTSFTPLPAEKFITVQTDSPMTAKKYPYMQDVIDFIFPVLEKQGIKIVQLGVKEEISLRKCINLLGQTNINQTAFLIKNSLLHFGIDSSLIHVANVFGIPCLGIYSVSPPEVSGACFEGKFVAIEPEFKDRSYMYNPGEQPSPTKTIKPEKVVAGLKELAPELFTETAPVSLYFGDRYQDQVIEVLPDTPVHPEFLKDKLLNIRLDFAFDLKKYDDNIFAQILQSRKCIIITDRPLNIGILMNFKSNIQTVMYRLDEKNDIEFVKSLKKAGIKFNLVTEDVERLNDLKFKYMDLEIVHLLKKPSIEDRNRAVEAMALENVTYKSNRFILSGGEIYLSKAALYKEKPIKSLDFLEQNVNIVEDKEKLIEELEYLYVYGK